MWKKSNGQTRYLLHDERYGDWVVQNGISVASAELYSEKMPDCPTLVARDKNNWWYYDAKVGNKWTWKADKSNYLHVECYQPGMKIPKPSAIENKTIENN